MEQKKPTTLSKAFSRAFGRKTAPDPPEATKQEAAPTALPPNKDHTVIDTHPTNVPAANHATDPAAHHPIHDTNGAAPLTTSGNPNPNPNPNVTFLPTTQPQDTVHHPDSAGVGPNHVHDGANLSRSSTLSRPGGLSDTEGHHNVNNPEGGLNPANILLNRLTAYHAVVKNLQLYFNEIALVEQDIGKAMHKASTSIAIPFKDGQQFLGKGGLQDVCVGVRDSAQTRSEQHMAAAKVVDETVVKNLRRLKRDIKAKIKGLKNDANLYATRVFKEREWSQEKTANLAKAIGLHENGGHHHQSDMEKAQSDPYLINLALRHQLTRQVQEENLFARALLQSQEQMMAFDRHVINEIKQTIRNFAQYQLNNSSAGFSHSWAPAEKALNALQDDTEWNYFMERNGHLLFPSDLVDADPEALDYPCKDSRYVVPLKTAHMSRRSSVLKNWKDGYFVMTLAGWLHVFSSANPANDPTPDRSIYLPTAILEPHSDPSQKQHVFSIEGRGMGGLLHREAQVFTIRANSREEMLDWWSEISKRAYSTMFTHQGDGQLEMPLSRSGSLIRSGSKKQQQQQQQVQQQQQQLQQQQQQPQQQQQQLQQQQQQPQQQQVAPAPAPAAVGGSVPNAQAPVYNSQQPGAIGNTGAPNAISAGAPTHVAPTGGVAPAPNTAYGGYQGPATEVPQNLTAGGMVPQTQAQGPFVGNQTYTGAPMVDPGMPYQGMTQPTKLQRYDTGSTTSLHAGEIPTQEGQAIGSSTAYPPPGIAH